MSHLIWLTGIPGSGKSTIAALLKDWRPNYVVLDENELCKGLFSDTSDQKEIMRRLVELCKLFLDYGHNVVTAFISPFEETRQEIKTYVDKCYIVYCKINLKDNLYEIPQNPDIILDTKNRSAPDNRTEIIRWLIDNKEG